MYTGVFLHSIHPNCAPLTNCAFKKLTELTVKHCCQTEHYVNFAIVYSVVKVRSKKSSLLDKG